MPVDVSFALTSDRLFSGAVLLYAMAMLAYAAAFAFLRSGRHLVAQTPAQTATVAPSLRRELVGAGGGTTIEGATSTLPPGPVGPVFGDDSTLDIAHAASTAVPARAPRGATLVARAAVAFTIGGWAMHVGSVIFRGLAAHRAPWGNMYEFSLMIALVAVTAFLVLMTRYPVRDLGVFVMLPVVVYLGVAGTVLYVPAGPLVPALHSYWIVIHVLAASSATGIFMVSAVANMLYLVRERHDRVLAAGQQPRLSRFASALPTAQNLDTMSYRLAAFAFPIWTFAIIAGAIWAEAAWGRYWGWDPKETWSFITWVVFACYLHARATAGWKGRRAAYLALIGFGCFLFDFYGVNMLVNGLHSYAGV